MCILLIHLPQTHERVLAYRCSSSYVHGIMDGEALEMAERAADSRSRKAPSGIVSIEIV